MGTKNTSMICHRRDNIHATEGVTGGLPASALPSSVILTAISHRRRGSIYAAVLGCSLAVTVIGLSALLALRVERRFVEGTGDFSQARLYAHSAIEDGLFRIHNDPDWRNAYPNGAWKSDAPIGTGTYTLIGEDLLDSDLTNSYSDSVVLTGIGVQGDARYKLQVRLDADMGALTCLEVAFSTADDLDLNDATANCDQTISSNGSVTGVATCQINGNAEAVGVVTGVAVSGSTTTGITPRTMPDVNTVYDYYKDNGTYIDINTIPDNSGVFAIEGVVISPMSNPFGTGVTNPEGIYIIDALGSRLEIRDSRIVGTLVILNGSAMCSYVQGAVNWEPAVSNYPALLVQGPLCLYMDGGILDEKDAGTSLNPESTPYGDLGNWDSDTDDTYPSIMTGLVYAESRLDVESSPVVDGVVVSGGIVNLTPFSVFDLTFDKTYLDNPPPGFGSTPEMVVSPGTWTQVVD